MFLVVNDEPIPSSGFRLSTNPRLPLLHCNMRSARRWSAWVSKERANTGGLGLGLKPDANIPFGVDEFAVYDPILPKTFFTTWYALYGQSAGAASLYEFAPSIRSATVARRYGISYVLEPHGAPGPSGSVFDRQVGHEDLYRIPDSAMATLVPAQPGSSPATDAPGKAVGRRLARSFSDSYSSPMRPHLKSSDSECLPEPGMESHNRRPAVDLVPVPLHHVAGTHSSRQTCH